MNILLSLGSKVRFLHMNKIPILMLLILGLLPGQAFAQLSCNSTFSGEVGDGSDIFYNEPVELSIDIGAGSIENGSYLDIYQLAFGPDCQPFGGIHDCASQGNNVVFNGITSTDCTDASGAPVNFTVTPVPGPAGPPAEVYNFTPNNPIRNFEPGEGTPNSCNIKFSVTIISLVNEDPPPPVSNSRLYQAIGWKLEYGLCENNQGTGQDINYSFDVSIPKIDIEKSTNGEDADTPTGPYLLLGDAVEWIYTVTNTGNVPLDNIVVTDDQLGTIGGCPSTSLEAGETMDCTTPDGVATLGQYVNESDVIGRYITNSPSTGDGVDVTDEDPSHYFGIDPSIELKKYVSIDGGATYVDANVAPFPTATAPSGALYRITVENTGPDDLENVVVTDPTLTLTYNVGSLLAGQTVVLDESTVPVIPELSVEEVCSAPGTFLNTASVNGNAVALVSATVFDDDPATMLCVGPSIELKKYVSIDSGATYEDANYAPYPTAPAPLGALYLITVENTGPLDLENVVVTDPTLGLTNTVGSLLAGQMVTLDEGTIPAIPELSVEEVCSEPGSFLNTAAANGNAVDSPGSTVFDDDPATLVCTEPGVAVPLLSNFGLLLLTSLILLIGFRVRRAR